MMGVALLEAGIGNNCCRLRVCGALGWGWGGRCYVGVRTERWREEGVC
jgi:hypothetical protein